MHHKRNREVKGKVRRNIKGWEGECMERGIEVKDKVRKTSG